MTIVLSSRRPMVAFSVTAYSFTTASSNCNVRLAIE
jgi:hypothetical protein